MRPTTIETHTRQPDVPALAARFAEWAAELRTPAVGLVRHTLRPGIDRLHTELGARVSYATKAGAHPLLLGELVDVVDEFNVTNLGHLEALLGAGVPAHRITWLHPVLTPAVMRAVLDRGIRRFVVDDRRGLDLLLSSGEAVAITLRLLPPDIGESSRSVVRFGNTEDALHELGRAAAAAGLTVEAVSFFVGIASANVAADMPYRCGIQALARLFRRLRADGIDIRMINIGGGFPGGRRRFHLDNPDFFRIVRSFVDAEFDHDVTVLCEPGRYLAEPTLVLLTRVLADRSRVSRRTVHLDASAYSCLFEHTFIDANAELCIWPADADGPWTPAELLGPIMDSFDVIRKARPLPALRDGALLVIPNVGAYTVGYSALCEGLQAPEIIPIPDDLSARLSEEWYP